jgi:hypothetical protein
VREMAHHIMRSCVPFLWRDVNCSSCRTCQENGTARSWEGGALVLCAALQSSSSISATSNHYIIRRKVFNTSSWLLVLALLLLLPLQILPATDDRRDEANSIKETADEISPILWQIRRRIPYSFFLDGLHRWWNILDPCRR